MAFKPPRRARIRLVAHQDGDRVGLLSPYDPNLIAEIKRQFGHSDRRWDADLKGWFFPVNLQQRVEQVCAACGLQVSVDTAIFPELADAGGAPPAAGPAPSSSRPPRANGAAKPAGAAAEDDRFYSRKYATDEDWAVLYLVPGAPLPVAKAAFRALQGMSHPDQGGRDADAQRVNVAWQRIEKQYAEET